MLFHLSGAASAAHADIFKASSKPCQLMPLKVAQAYKHIRIHDSTSYLCLFYHFSSLYRHAYIICAFEPVANDDMTSCREDIEPILISSAQMLQSVFPPADIECIAICQERTASQLLHYISHSLRIVRTKERQVARLAKMNLYSCHFFVKINLSNSRFFDEFFQFIRQICT